PPGRAGGDARARGGAGSVVSPSREGQRPRERRRSDGVRGGPAVRDRRPLSYSGGGPITRQPLWPPNPNEFDSAGAGVHGRAEPVTMSRWISGSGCSWPMVGGISFFSTESASAAASIAPAAPSACPVTPLIDVTG